MTALSTSSFATRSPVDSHFMFALDAETNMYRVILPPNAAFRQIDISAAWGTLDEDLQRRDFTVNALACSLDNFDASTGNMSIIGAAQGITDIENRCLRAVAPDIFQKDPARLLRGVRLAVELGFTIEPTTETTITANADLLATVAGERTREELLRLLSLPMAGTIVEYLDRLSLLTKIFPELEPSRGIEQPKEHAWDVLNHQMKTVASLDWILGQGSWPHAAASVRELIPLPARIMDYFATSIGSGATRMALSRLAALLHDIAKPETKILTDSGRIRFFGHAQKGAGVVETLLERLRFSKRETAFVSAMVKAHLRPVQMGPEAMLPTPKAVYRYLRDTGEAAVANLYLSLADHLAARGPSLELDNFREHVTIVNYILTEYQRQAAKSKETPLITGHDLQKRFGLRPGPEIGKILTAAREAQATGEILTPGEAIELAGRLISQEPGRPETGMPH